MGKVKIKMNPFEEKSDSIDSYFNGLKYMLSWKIGKKSYGLEFAFFAKERAREVLIVFQQTIDYTMIIYRKHYSVKLNLQMMGIRRTLGMKDRKRMRHL